MKSSCKTLSQLVVDGGGPSHGGWCHPLAGAPGFYRRQAEQAMGVRPMCSTPLWPLYQLLPPGSIPA